MRDTVARARALRRRAPEVEMRLWRLLRARQVGGAKFRRQHPIGPYIADFYCHKARLVVEVDGGGHAEDTQAAADARRTAWLEGTGIRVLRFWDNDVLQNPEGVLERVMEAVLSPRPHPRPLPQGEGTNGPGSRLLERDSDIPLSGSRS
ncbi:MAG: endonuclease domain-containing protein [Dehalococcoidia bacterium]